MIKLIIESARVFDAETRRELAPREILEMFAIGEDLRDAQGRDLSEQQMWELLEGVMKKAG